MYGSAGWDGGSGGRGDDEGEELIENATVFV